MAVRYCAQWCLLIRTCHSPKVDLHRFEVSFANSVSLEFKVFSQGGGCKKNDLHFTIVVDQATTKLQQMRI